jgi:hypothetical protein
MKQVNPSSSHLHLPYSNTNERIKLKLYYKLILIR